MFFRKKDKLKKEYDGKLIQLLEQSRQDWVRNKELVRLSFEYNENLEAQTKISEAKYFFLFREVKKRNVRIKN
ncbi:hypothetical protein JOC78_003496 [Bacillus ectoiniformans]|uniref:YaaL family protein n=1 Tax=Bacillus ectoiniformans TaxID=1494429 RepID=UPI00195D876B|nr:YaaL family protein [Bacillus ectoiniformans]MBM7650504.1 hypothetical protein [Bacillus ectoiniformans]